jgi:hypothetical protein
VKSLLDLTDGLPLGRIRVIDRVDLAGDGTRRKLVEVLVDDEPVARLPITGARFDICVHGHSKLTLELIADDAVMHSRGEIGAIR